MWFNVSGWLVGGQVSYVAVVIGRVVFQGGSWPGMAKLLNCKPLMNWSIVAHQSNSLVHHLV